ncbi:TPA: hypothetical protein PXM11_003617 [Yersinia enterocolitica]|uniref:hypothetical protein n=1 Tax=Yersinia enterocolitica TaxID=630 RepID=UPI0012AEF08A|nr:hypothetical protein [Yersinia enterocolitica]HDL6968172.1 hypothetical protein [Yersinia enterocolitica]HDL6972435.1 hypothetical protein [Yersinia enterocolitica]HDL6988872.1 hypothetical protein [Yersinia enterocolitica]HDL6997533.1 hypothetical protein [Yersinia enterocolitica]HDL7096535.1 hypothetical protein [Yersinia enterocolitica]
MKINSAFFKENSFYIQADAADPFWVLLSKKLGWGKFTIVEGCDPSTGLFELTELRAADSEPPESVAVASNVLWHPQVALSVALSYYSSSQDPEMKRLPPLEGLREYQREVARLERLRGH